MTSKRNKGLGRGLEALLGPKAPDISRFITENGETDLARQPATLPLLQLVPGQYQPRIHMDEGALYELAESIKAQGIMQPILVRLLEDETAQIQRQSAAKEGRKLPANTPLYEIIAGERRFRAAHLAGLSDVPVLVRNVSNEAAAAMALIENMQREDLNALEEAQGLQRLINEFGMTHEQAAQAIGRSRSAASNLLRLLQLAQPVQTMLMAGDLDMGHARALLPLAGAQQVIAAQQIVQGAMSVREAERLVQRLLNPPKKPGEKPVDRDLLRLQEEISDVIGAAVAISSNKKGAGRITIEFGDLDQLEGILGRLR